MKSNRQSNKKQAKGVDIKKLVKDHPNDPHIGQGYNDARGEFSETESDADFEALKKKRQDPRP